MHGDSSMIAEHLDITPNKDGGVLKKILQAGAGAEKPSSGTTVQVHYVGTLDDGTQFDSSRDRGTLFEFNLGKGQVIKGWDLGVATMTKGEKSEFIIRGNYGYGATGSPPKIPPDATLHFEVELLDWVAEDISPDRDGTIRRSVIVPPADKIANPNETSTVQVHIVGFHAGRQFMDEEISFSLGEGCEHRLPEGVDKALRRFGKGEKSTIFLKGTRYTYGTKPPPEFNLPPNADLQFTIFLKEFEKVPATWEMTAEDKIRVSKEAKERGTAFLQEGKLRLALNKYKRIEEILEYEKSGDPEQKKDRNALMLAAYLNISLVYSKLDEQLKCVQYCDKALEQSPDNVKALYRKGVATLTMNEPEAAALIFENVIQLEPANKAAVQQLMMCKAKVKEHEERDKKRFRGMFDKLAKEQPSTSEAS